MVFTSTANLVIARASLRSTISDHLRNPTSYSRLSIFYTSQNACLHHFLVRRLCRQAPAWQVQLPLHRRLLVLLHPLHRHVNWQQLLKSSTFTAQSRRHEIYLCDHRVRYTLEGGYILGSRVLSGRTTAGDLCVGGITKLWVASNLLDYNIFGSSSYVHLHW